MIAMLTSVRPKANLPGHQYVVIKDDAVDISDSLLRSQGDSQGTNEAEEEDDVMKDVPTELELKTLRRISGDIPWQAYSIAFVELCERFSWYGTTAVCKSPRTFAYRCNIHGV